MIVNNGYSIEQYPNENKIVIILPQTEETVAPISKVGAETRRIFMRSIALRRTALSTDELYAVLYTVKYLFEREMENDEQTN